jgi:flagellar hook-length control protein FliK
MSTAIAATVLAPLARMPGLGTAGQVPGDAGALFALLLGGMLPIAPGGTGGQPPAGQGGHVVAPSPGPSSPQLASFPKQGDDARPSPTAVPAPSSALEQAVPAPTLPFAPAPAIVQPGTLESSSRQAGTAAILEEPPSRSPVQLATPAGTATTAEPDEQALSATGIAPRPRPANAQLPTVSAPAPDEALDAGGHELAPRSLDGGAARPQPASGPARWAPGPELPAPTDRIVDPVSGRVDLNPSQAPSLRPASIQLRAQAPIGLAAGVQLDRISQTGDQPAGDGRSVASIDGVDLPSGRTERGSLDVPAPPARAPLAPPALQIAHQIVRAAHQRVERMMVQLEPAELGRVEVRLDFSHDGRMSALIATDRPEALDLLQRDARALERSLEQAGLRLDSGGLSFALKRDGGHGQASSGWPGSELPGDPGSPKAGADHEAQHGPPAMLSLRLLDLQV